MLTRKCNVLSIMQECRPDLSSKSECLETSNRKRKYEKSRRRQIYRTQEMSEKRSPKSNGYLGRISTDGNNHIHPCQPEPDTCRCGGVNVVIRYTLPPLSLDLNFELCWHVAVLKWFRLPSWSHTAVHPDHNQSLYQSQTRLVWPRKRNPDPHPYRKAPLV